MTFDISDISEPVAFTFEDFDDFEDYIVPEADPSAPQPPRMATARGTMPPGVMRRPELSDGVPSTVVEDISDVIVLETDW